MVRRSFLFKYFVIESSWSGNLLFSTFCPWTLCCTPLVESSSVLPKSVVFLYFDTLGFTLQRHKQVFRKHKKGLLFRAREGTTTEFHSSTSWTPLVDY